MASPPLWVSHAARTGHRQCASAVSMVGITVTVSQYRGRWIASMFREDEDSGRHSFDETNGIWTAALWRGKFGIKDRVGDPLKLCPFGHLLVVSCWTLIGQYAGRSPRTCTTASV